MTRYALVAIIYNNREPAKGWFPNIKVGGIYLLNGVKIFSNEEFGEIRTLVINNEPWFVGKDIATILGYAKPTDTVRKRVDNEDKGISKMETPSGAQDIVIINESGLYSLILGSKLESAKKFKRWITSDVLPTIRKTGGYVNNEDLFINTYLPFADDNTKLLFSTTLATVRKQNEIIKNQQSEIEHKQEVINGLTDDIDIYKKKDIINRICKRSHNNYANRYKELYKCFSENYHIDLEARCEGYNLRQGKRKDRLSVIKYVENFGHVDDLYSCCVKLYETEVDKILENLNELHSL